LQRASVSSPTRKCCKKFYIVDEVLPIGKAEVLRAGEIAQSRVSMSARNAVHIAVMERHGIRSILSFDGDFDRWPGLQRIHRI
jgi:predicted nucleic acid-binding protein